MPANLIILALLIVLSLLGLFLASQVLTTWIGKRLPLYLVKSLNLVGMFVVFSWLFRGAHEEGHALTALTLGIEGEVKFWWSIARFYYPEGVYISPTQEMWVALGGGLAVFAAFWILLSLKNLSLRYCTWDLDDVFTLHLTALWNLLYSFTEVIRWPFWGGGASLALALGISLWIYGKRLAKWLELSH